MSGKVLLIIGDAAESTDTLYPYFRVQEDGYECVVAAPDKRTYHLVQHDLRPGWDITKEMESYLMDSDIAFRDVDPSEYVGLIISGGRAPEYLRYDQDLMRIVRHFFEQNKPVASVCHGAEIVATADVIRGRRLATVAKCQFDVEICGGVFVDEAVVVDGNLISARTWHDNAPFMREYMKLLNASSGSAKGV